MIPLDEQLSQLWSGDLPEAEARALRHRIATEPEVAAAWERLRTAIEALEALPDAMTPPPVRRSTPARRRTSPRAILPWLLAAAALLLWALPARRPEIVLASGTQWVEGELSLHAGDALVDLDGSAWISVEPPLPLARVGGRPEDLEEPVNRSTLIAGLAGAAVTVIVYQGTAVVRAAGEPPAVVTAGEQHRIAPRSAPAPGNASSAAEQLQNIARLEEELAKARTELAEAQFEGALTRGQLLALQGVPSEWPADVSEVLAPEQFRAELEAKLATLGDVELTELDCSEYPCIAALRQSGGADDDAWNERLRETIGTWLQGAFPDGLSLNTNTSRFSDDDHTERYVIFGAHPEDRESDVGTRTEYRIDALVDELGQRMRERPQP